MTTVDTRTVPDSSLAVGSAGPRTVTIDRAKETGGSAFGMQRWRTAAAGIGGCYSNDIFPRSRRTRDLSEKVTGHGLRRLVGGASERTKCSVRLEADATQGDALDLIRHADRVVEIPNSLRFGTAVKPAELKAIPHR